MLVRPGCRSPLSLLGSGPRPRVRAPRLTSVLFLPGRRRHGPEELERDDHRPRSRTSLSSPRGLTVRRHHGATANLQEPCRPLPLSVTALNRSVRWPSPRPSCGAYADRLREPYLLAQDHLRARVPGQAADGPLRDAHRPPRRQPADRRRASASASFRLSSAVAALSEGAER